LAEQRKDLVTRFKRKAKLQKRRRAIFRTFIVLCILFLIYYWAARIDFFNIDAISVTGNISAPEADILSDSGLNTGVNGLFVMYRSILGLPVLRMYDVEKHLAADFPFIDRVTVRYLIPDKVSIIIKEREPVFMIDIGGTKYFMDIEARIIGPADKRPDISLPVIFGLETTDKVPGDSLLPENDRKFATLEALITSMKSIDKNDGYALYNSITAYDLTDLFSVSFHVNAILAVKIGDIQNIDAKIRFVDASLAGDLAGKAGIFTYTADGRWIFTKQ
jgi:cell division septal protein FtsQ